MEKPPLSVVVPSFSVAAVTLGAMFAMQIGIHRQAKRRIPATSSASPPVSPG
jgi:hypothetical protein